MSADQWPGGRTLRIRADVVKKLRIQKGWGTKDLAAKAVCSTKTIENMERGKEVYLATLVKVAKALGSAVDTLLENPDQGSPGPPAPPSPGKRVRWEVTFRFTGPSFEEYDETKDLVAFIKLLQKLSGNDDPGGGNTIEVTDVTEGSILVKVQMTEHEYNNIQKSLRFKYYNWFHKFKVEVVVAGTLKPKDRWAIQAEQLQEEEYDKGAGGFRV